MAKNNFTEESNRQWLIRTDKANKEPIESTRKKELLNRKKALDTFEASKEVTLTEDNYWGTL